MNKKNILGVGITDASKKEVLEYIVKNLENFTEKSYFVTPNPEFLVLANKNITFKNILNNADLALADGVGVMIAAKILGKPLKDRFAGVDLVKSLCKEVSEKPITVGFLGGRGGVAELTAECLRKKYPGLKVGFVGEEWLNGEKIDRLSHVAGDVCSSDRGPVKSNPSRQCSFAVRAVGSPSSFATPKMSSANKNNLTIRQFDKKKIDILFVAFGCPKQEFWISENLPKIPVKIAIGVGGAFDYISGKVPRAPGFLRTLGLEWLFRLIVQPWRIKRQLSLIEFIYLVLKERINQ
jgi:N-acetylglucosaminyldiphosphoundecaprenol N-acetyl-beta-D-mannosaminyltransferase